MKEFQIRDTLGYYVALLCRNHRAKANDLLSDIGLYTGQEMILTYLKDHNLIPQNQLAEEMNVKPATMTTGLKRLEKSGYISRNKNEKDNRIMDISLTDKGIEIQDPISQVWMKFEKMSFESFTDEEKIIFRRLILQIISNLS